MRSKEDIQLPAYKGRQSLLLLLSRNHAAKETYFERKLMQSLLEVSVVLLCKDCRGGKECNLLSAHNGFENSTEGYLSLSIAYISAYKAVHDGGAFHVVLYVLDACKLVLSFIELEFSLELELPVVVLCKRKAFAVAPSCIQLYEMRCKVLCALTGLGLLVLPSSASKFVKTRSFSSRANVTLHQVGLLYWNVQILLVCKLYLYVVAVADPIYFQEASNAVVHMDDEVPFMKFHEAVYGTALSMLQRLYNLFATAKDLVLADYDKLPRTDSKAT